MKLSSLTFDVVVEDGVILHCKKAPFTKAIAMATVGEGLSAKRKEKEKDQVTLATEFRDLMLLKMKNSIVSWEGFEAPDGETDWEGQVGLDIPYSEANLDRLAEDYFSFFSEMTSAFTKAEQDFLATLEEGKKS